MAAVNITIYGDLKERKDFLYGVVPKKAHALQPWDELDLIY